MKIEALGLGWMFVLGASACAVTGDETGSAEPQTTMTTMTADELRTAGHARVCTSADDEAHCHARAVVDAAGAVRPNSLPAGYRPADLRSAYAITGSGSAATTIAVVVALGYPRAETDLATYRSTFGLPACIAASGCFRKVNQTGGTTYPAADVGWSEESALDLDMASAICPNCKLLLVEATTASNANLAAAENEAAALGAHVIGNSYGGGESGSTAFEAAYNHPGIAITASAGDSGFGVEFPASSPHVTAVTGTSLSPASTKRGWTETALGPSGCSTTYAKPTWQHDTFCTKRTVVDVAAVGDPNTGVAVFGPTSSTASAWLVFGGTSVSAAIIAGVYGVNGGPVTYGSDPYAHPTGLFDITTGPGAGPGYDLATGMGTPDGTTAF
jgi:subtilase family serine protease